MNPLYNEKDCLDQAQLLRYVYDECSPEEARIFDRHLDNCPLCSAAVEGLMSAEKEEVEQTLTNIKHFIDTKTNNKTNMLTIKQTTNKKWITWAAAASVVTVASALWLFTRPETLQQSSSSMATNGLIDSTNTLLAAQTNISDTVNNKNVLQDSLKNVAATAIDSNNVQDVADADVATHTEATPTPTPAPTPSPSVNVIPAEKTLAAENAKEDYGFKLEKAPASESDAVSGMKPPPPPSPPAAAIPAEAVTKKQSSNTSITPSVANSSQKARIEKTLESDEKVYEAGLAFYKNGSYAAAIERFNAVVSRKGWGNIYEDALWYMGNSHLKQGDKNSAKAIFERIVREKSRYAKDAEKALRRL